MERTGAVCDRDSRSVRMELRRMDETSVRKTYPTHLVSQKHSSRQYKTASITLRDATPTLRGETGAETGRLRCLCRRYGFKADGVFQLFQRTVQQNLRNGYLDIFCEYVGRLHVRLSASRTLRLRRSGDSMFVGTWLAES